MGLFLGLTREAATRFAFLLAIPAVVGAGLFELKEIPDGENTYGWGPTIVATVVSFVVGSESTPPSGQSRTSISSTGPSSPSPPTAQPSAPA